MGIASSTPASYPSTEDQAKWHWYSRALFICSWLGGGGGCYIFWGGEGVINTYGRAGAFLLLLSVVFLIFAFRARSVAVAYLPPQQTSDGEASANQTQT